MNFERDREWRERERERKQTLPYYGGTKERIGLTWKKFPYFRQRNLIYLWNFAHNNTLN